MWAHTLRQPGEQSVNFESFFASDIFSSYFKKVSLIRTNIQKKITNDKVWIYVALVWHENNRSRPRDDILCF